MINFENPSPKNLEAQEAPKLDHHFTSFGYDLEEAREFITNEIKNCEAKLDGLTKKIAQEQEGVSLDEVQQFIEQLRERLLNNESLANILRDSLKNKKDSEKWKTEDTLLDIFLILTTIKQGINEEQKRQKALGNNSEEQDMQGYHN